MDVSQSYLAYRGQDHVAMQEADSMRKAEEQDRLTNIAKMTYMVENPAEGKPIEQPPNDLPPTGPAKETKPKTKWQQSVEEIDMRLGGLKDIEKGYNNWVKAMPKNFAGATASAIDNSFSLVIGRENHQEAKDWVNKTFPGFAKLDDAVSTMLAPENSGDQITQDILQFFVPFSGYMKMFGNSSKLAAKTQGLLGKSPQFADKAIPIVAADLATNISAMDPHMDRFATLIQGFGVENEFIDYIVSDAGSDNEERFKNALDSAVAGAGFTTVFWSAKALKGMWNAAPEIMARAKAAPLGPPPGSKKAQLGMVSFHGSPHKFPPTKDNPLGEFDMSKIGSGEGAQAYGYGIYLAENPGVASTYKTRLTDRALEIPGLDPAVNRQLARDFRGSDFDTIEEIPDDWWKVQAENLIDNGEPALAKKLLAADKSKARLTKGSVYEVDIPDKQIEKMLDWDGLLDEQPKSVQDALKKSDFWKFAQQDLENMSASEGLNPTGKDLYKWLSEDYDPKEVSAMLNELGIPGIKYFDGASRKSGKGSRNFVIFDPSVAKIIGAK